MEQRYMVLLNPTNIKHHIECRQLAIDHNCTYTVDRHVQDADGSGIVSMIANDWTTAVTIVYLAVHNVHIKAGVHTYP